MHFDTARRGRRLPVALAFLGLDLPPAARPSGLHPLHTWLGPGCLDREIPVLLEAVLATLGKEGLVRRRRILAG